MAIKLGRIGEGQFENMTVDYQSFLEQKQQSVNYYGFEPLFLPDFLFDFQKHIVTWSTLKGRSAVFADCGLGKTPMQLVWSQNTIQKENKPVLLLTPLAVTNQTHAEAQKFGIESEISRDGKFNGKLVITNYERLHYFNWQDFCGAVCDESSILKNFDGAIKRQVTDFMRKLPYRLLCTATAAPNDYIELGTSSEALGELGYIDMLKMFFKAEGNTYAQGGGNGKGIKRFDSKHFGGKFHFRGHAQQDFWRWVCSWARACRKPSDLGFDDGKFKLPELITRQHTIKARTLADGYLFSMPAVGLKEQRSERRRTLEERCEKAAELCSQHESSVAWCYLNDEGDLLEKLIPDCVQVAGADSLEVKEERLEAFRLGQIKRLVTKPDIAGFGCNWQHCAHSTFFPSHSFEQWYQSVRRFWRFGQTKTVQVDIVSSEGELDVLKNLQRKAQNAEAMFQNLIRLMNNELKIERKNMFTKQEETPVWL